MTTFFKAPIPRHSDGKIAAYSPGWCGEMARCPKDMQALLYNDAEAYLIASSEDADGVQGCVDRGEVEIIEEAEALKIVEESDGNNEMIFKADKLTHRWDPKPVEAVTVDDGSPKAEPKPRQVIDSKATTCKKCHKLSAVIYLNSDSTMKITQAGRTLIDGISINPSHVPNVYISCPSGHSINALTGELKPKEAVKA